MTLPSLLGWIAVARVGVYAQAREQWQWRFRLPGSTSLLSSTSNGAVLQPLTSEKLRLLPARVLLGHGQVLVHSWERLRDCAAAKDQRLRLGASPPQKNTSECGCFPESTGTSASGVASQQQMSSQQGNYLCLVARRPLRPCSLHLGIRPSHQSTASISPPLLLCKGWNAYPSAWNPKIMDWSTTKNLEWSTKLRMWVEARVLLASLAK
ncbi:uncharacterized protein LOC115275250 [Suricata suricatta]|uniref:uncharacterized protein LOC115275250 n=1 Tax=Suricata suricatta TaxID=37032 RepID=UPI00115572CB|nr:uncharacterized protein LOC115275250 [Suricata suricatta]